MRLFTGLDLPSKVVRSLDALLDRLRPTARVKWSPPANLHITTRFIGEWPAACLPGLAAALAAMPASGIIPIHVRKLRFYPDSQAPRVFWAGVEPKPAQAALALETDRALGTLGL